MDTKSISSQLSASEPSEVDVPISITSSESLVAIDILTKEGEQPSSHHVGTAPITIHTPQKLKTGFEQLESGEILDVSKLDDVMSSNSVHKPAQGGSDSPKIIIKPSNQKAVATVAPFSVQPSTPKSVLKSSSVTPGSSPARQHPLGSLLSQRLQLMPESSPAPSQRSVQISPRVEHIDSQYDTPQSPRSLRSTDTPELHRHGLSSQIIGSMSSMGSGSTLRDHMDSPKHSPKKKSKLPHKHMRQNTTSDSGRPGRDPASFRSLFESITVWRSGSILSRHLSQGGSSQRINYVTEAQSVIPSLTSAFSIDHLHDAAGFQQAGALGLFDLDTQRSVSHQDQLDVLEALDDPDYVDTVKSTDSAASLLRRSLSVPSRYHYKPQKRHVQDIFGDPHAENIDPMTGKTIRKPFQVVPADKWRQTMDDLLEQPEYLDSLESACSKTGLLASHARVLAQQGYGIKPPVIGPSISTEEQKRTNKQLKFIYFKNLIVLSLGFMFIFMAYMSLRNLQSSLYKASGLGIIALSVIYVSLFVGCIFATTLVQHLRPKRTILLCIAGTFLYVVANFHPAFYTLIPASAVVGFTLANVWTAHATYMANVASRYAVLIDDKVQNVLSQFNGIFFAFFQTSQIIGGLVSSLVLSPKQDDDVIGNLTNISLVEPTQTYSNVTSDLWPQCGAYYCPPVMDDPSAQPDSPRLAQSLIYILVGFYMACVVVGFLIIALCMDPLDGVMKKPHSSMCNQLTAVFRFFGHWKVLCLVGLMFYTLLQSSYMFGEFTKAFVTCTTGVYMVGYTTVCLSSCSAVSAFVSGRMQRYVGRMPLFSAAFSLQATLIVVQIFWQPGPDSLIIMFAISGCWGLADGIICTQTISLFGVIFADNKEPAFAGLKMCQALSAAVLFGTSELLCTSAKLYVLLGVLLAAAAGYYTLEGRLSKQAPAKTLGHGPTAV